MSASGDVTAVGNGTTTVNASAGSASAAVAVTVQQVATQVVIISGDGQTGAVGAALASALVVQSSDAGGAAVGSVGLSLAVVAGGGVLSATSVTTDEDGRGSSSWTLGTEAGTQQVTASIDGVTGGTASFSAEAAAGPPVSLAVESGNNQSGAKGFALAAPAVVKLADEFGNGVEGGTVTFAVTGGGGTVAPAAVMTGSDGLGQTVWTMGPAQGANLMTATVPSFDAVAFSATALGVSDLVVGAITTSPVFPIPADAVTATAVITNGGDGPTVIGFPVRVLLDDVEQARVTVSQLAPGAAFTVNLPLGALADGTYVLSVEADPDGIVPESDETNNSSAGAVTSATGTALQAGTPVAGLAAATGSVTFFTIEVPGPTAAPGEGPVAQSILVGQGAHKPGPTVGDIRRINGSPAQAYSASAVAGTVSQLDVTLTGGTGDADLYVHLGGRPDDLADWDCFSLTFTNEETCTFMDPAPGVYHIGVRAFAAFSGLSVNAETVVTFPDLTVSSVTVTPASPTLSQTVAVDVVVSNGGDGPTVVDFTTRLLVDGIEAESATVSALSAGGTANVSFTTGPLAKGDHTFGVVVDPDDVVDESNEANNTTETQVTAVDATPIVAGTALSGLAGVAGGETFFTIEVPAATGAQAWGAVASSIEAGVGAQKFASASRESRTVDFDASAAGYAVAAAITQLEITLSEGTGAPDLYVNHGTRGSSGPSPTDWDCASTAAATTESCVFNNPAPGTYHIMVQGFSDFSGVSLLGTTSEGPVEGAFKIELVYINHGTASQDAAFQAAADRWMSVITADVPNITVNLAANACSEGSPAFSGEVDDLIIYVDILAIDGVFNTVGQAGPCIVRGGSMIPAAGSMQFDNADLARMETDGDLLEVALHEMGHVLGAGVLWDDLGLIQNPSLPENGGTQGADTHFTGPLAIAAFNAGGGTGYTGGGKVPVENMLGEGSGDSHWREDPLAEELMTPSFVAGQTLPLSAISIQSMADMGYTVDVGQADAYSRVFTSPARAPAPGARVIDLSNDVLRNPITVVDEQGRVIRVIR